MWLYIHVGALPGGNVPQGQLRSSISGLQGLGLPVAWGEAPGFALSGSGLEDECWGSNQREGQ